MSFEPICVAPSTPLFDVLKQMDKEDTKLLMVMEDDRFISLVSIGDVQRAILANKSLQSEVSSILRENITVGSIEDHREDLKRQVLEKRMEYLPIINKSNQLVDVIFWSDVTSEQRITSDKLKDIPVVIMAGGKGTRLRPITNVIPKALVPLGEKPIIQIIVEKFISFGCRKFFVSVNYKGEMIE
ncbi:MAG: CBS domain-containing protein, partial [Flavobacteriales bacterium]|nr:CBS domain-containing protein [Flavobacteriales bacterium]